MTNQAIDDDIVAARVAPVYIQVFPERPDCILITVSEGTTFSMPPITGLNRADCSQRRRRTQMSDYGKLWEQVSTVRAELKRLMPTVNTNTLDDAIAAMKTISALVERWSALEKEMALCDPQTGRSNRP
jgi:hypothetical protein